MEVAAPAKINLTLDILDRRPDGYHNISSVMQTIRLFDRLDIELTDSIGEIELTLDGPMASDLPTDHRNLVTRAASQILTITGAASGARIRLTKHIPSQAGLGGGSSDAAATLRAMNSLFGEPFRLEELVALGVRLGADVPFFLYGGTCLVEGIGEKVTPLQPLAPQFVVILKPNIGVSTAEAYRTLDEQRDEGEKRTAAGWDGKTLRNDFQDSVTAAHPEIAKARATLLVAGCSQALLCGSGSSVFGLVDMEKGDEIMRRVADYGNGLVFGVPTAAAGEWD